MEPGLVPLAIYVHLPWCVRKCPYCDFNSHTHRGPIPQTRYLDALLDDLVQEQEQLDNQRVIQSIFFGGGTPSLFSAVEIERFLNHVGQNFDMANDIEITLEANPGTVEHDLFESYWQAGVNRISLGVQTFDDSLLPKIGRIHDATVARSSLESIRRAGFQNFNVDLMFSLPGQSLEQASADIIEVCGFNVPHVSWYQLTLEPGTPFHQKPPEVPDMEQAWAIQDTGHVVLSHAGFEQYEVSAFAQPGHQCKHNLNYWEYGDYIGVGAGAHGKLTQANGSILRREKVRHPNRFMNSPHTTKEHWVAPRDQVFEFMLNQLRLKNGFSKAHFLERTQVGLADLETRIDSVLEQGFLQETVSGWVPTPLGFRFLNDLQRAFLPD